MFLIPRQFHGWTEGGNTDKQRRRSISVGLIRLQEKEVIAMFPAGVIGGD